MSIINKELVDGFEKLQEIKKEIEIKIEKIKKELINLAESNNTDMIIGTNKKCSIKEYEKIIYPEDKEKLLSLIKSKGLYEQFSSINYFKLTPKILKNEVDEEIISLIQKEKDHKVFLLNKNRKRVRGLFIGEE